MSVPQRDPSSSNLRSVAPQYGYPAPPLTAAHFTPRGYGPPPVTASHYVPSSYGESPAPRTGARYPLYSGSAAEPAYTGARYPYGLDEVPTHTSAYAAPSLMSVRSTASRFSPSYTPAAAAVRSYDSPHSTAAHYNPNPYSSSGGTPLTGLRYSPPGSQFPSPLYTR